MATFLKKVADGAEDGKGETRKPVEAKPVEVVRPREERLKSILERFPKTIEYLGR